MTNDTKSQLDKIAEHSQQAQESLKRKEEQAKPEVKQTKFDEDRTRRLLTSHTSTQELIQWCFRWVFRAVTIFLIFLLIILRQGN